MEKNKPYELKGIIIMKVDKVKIEKVNSENKVPITFFADYEIAHQFYEKLKSENVEIENELEFLKSIQSINKLKSSVIIDLIKSKTKTK